MENMIVADSSCDLTPELHKKMDIELVPFKIDVDDKSFIDDKSIDIYDLVSKMKASPNPVKTSTPSPGDFFEAYKKAQNVFVVTISKELSATYNSAILAKDMIVEEIKDKFVHVFNSKSASVGETLVAMKINECLDLKLTNEAIVEKVESFIENMKTYFVSEDLSNLIKNGRISRTQGLIANVLNIKPIMRGTEEGFIEAVEKVRGTKKAIKRLGEIIAATGVDFQNRILAISHAGDIEKALSLKEDLMPLNFKDIIIVETKGLSTVYVNDGGIIVAF